MHTEAIQYQHHYSMLAAMDKTLNRFSYKGNEIQQRVSGFYLNGWRRFDTLEKCKKFIDELKAEQMANKFLLSEQKEHLAKLAETLTLIESCDMLGESDPAFYGNKKQEYIILYAMQMSQMAQSIFEKGVHTINAKLIGEIKAGVVC